MSSTKIEVDVDTVEDVVDHRFFVYGIGAGESQAGKIARDHRALVAGMDAVVAGVVAVVVPRQVQRVVHVFDVVRLGCGGPNEIQPVLLGLCVDHPIGEVLDVSLRRSKVPCRLDSTYEYAVDRDQIVDVARESAGVELRIDVDVDVVPTGRFLSGAGTNRAGVDFEEAA